MQPLGVDELYGQLGWDFVLFCLKILRLLARLLTQSNIFSLNLQPRRYYHVWYDELEVRIQSVNHG